jgi:hypothetical protein
MTKAEAEARCRKLATEHPDRAAYRWFARSAEDGWAVVKVPVPEHTPIEPLSATEEARPRPSYPEDPRRRPQGGEFPWT